MASSAAVHLRLGADPAEKCSPSWKRRLGRPVINRYGMTEAHVITSLPLDGPWPQGSVGLPLDGIEVRVVNDDGTPAAPGEVGSVQLRGPNLFREYWRNRMRPARLSPPAGSTRRPGLPRRIRVPDPGRAQERSDHHQWIQRLSPGRRAGDQRVPGRARIGRGGRARQEARRTRDGGRRSDRRDAVTRTGSGAFSANGWSITSGQPRSFSSFAPA